MIIEKDFARKPSIVSINCTVRDAIKKQADYIVMQWGENQITLEHDVNGWFGHGWLGRIGGSDIADKLNKG